MRTARLTPFPSVRRALLYDKRGRYNEGQTSRPRSVGSLLQLGDLCNVLTFSKALSRLSRWRLGTDISTNLVGTKRSLQRELDKPFCLLKSHVTIRVTQLTEHYCIQLLFYPPPFTTKPSCCFGFRLCVLWHHSHTSSGVPRPQAQTPPFLL